MNKEKIIDRYGLLTGKDSEYVGKGEFGFDTDRVASTAFPFEVN